MDFKKMIAVVQCYIHHIKGVQVNITPNMPYDLPKLITAYNIAYDYFYKNK